MFYIERLFLFNVSALFALCLCTGGMHNKLLYYIFNINLDLVAVIQISFFPDGSSVLLLWMM